MGNLKTPSQLLEAAKKNAKQVSAFVAANPQVIPSTAVVTPSPAQHPAPAVGGTSGAS